MLFIIIEFKKMVRVCNVINYNSFMKNKIPFAKCNTRQDVWLKALDGKIINNNFIYIEHFNLDQYIISENIPRLLKTILTIFNPTNTDIIFDFISLAKFCENALIKYSTELILIFDLEFGEDFNTKINTEKILTQRF